MKGDFTEYGYACPQIPQPRDAVGGKLPGEKDRKYDEFACLNLTISAPLAHLPNGSEGQVAKGLPVMVYVHGGALEEGAGHISAVHDSTKFVDLAQVDSMGVVVVNIGYRLNWFGFLACQDLIDEAEDEIRLGASDPPVFNYGLRDQRNAFSWIKQNISGFGGDPNNITAFGESAGAVALSAHLCSDAPLFHRAVLQSGSMACLTKVSKDYHEHLYQSLLEFLGINTDTAAARLEALRATPAQRLVDGVAAFARMKFRPYVGPEGKFFPTPPTWVNQGSLIANCPWIGDIMIGDTFFEGYVFYDIMKMTSQLKFTANARTVLGHQGVARLLQAYDIDPEGKMDPNLFFSQSMILAGDITFSEPVHSISSSLVSMRSKDGSGKKVYRYSFGLRNPFPGSHLYSVPGHHFVENLYQFLTLTSRFPKDRNKFLERQAKETARVWIRFGNGLAPLENAEYDLQEARIAVCDELRGWQVRSRSDDEETSKSDPWGRRRYEMWEILAEEYFRQAQWDSGSDIGEVIDGIRTGLLDWASFTDGNL